MADIKDKLKNVVSKFTKASKINKDAVDRMRKQQEAAAQAVNKK